ncbi:MAG: hypothetical protein U0531_14640 [Dehalococcoidia bacterium]
MRGLGLLLALPAAALTAAVSLLSVSDGRRRSGAGVDAAPDDWPDGEAPQTAAEALGEHMAEVVVRGFRRLGARGEELRGRVEGYYGLYRVMKALGMSDADIAALVARQAGRPDRARCARPHAHHR